MIHNLCNEQSYFSINSYVFLKVFTFVYYLGNKSTQN